MALTSPQEVWQSLIAKGWQGCMDWISAWLLSLLLLFLCSSTGTHTHTQRKNFAVSENGYDESRIAPLGNFLSFFSSLPKTRAFVTGVIILFHLLYFFFRLFNVNKHSSSCLCLGSYKEGLVLHSYSHIQAELLDIQNFCSKRGWTWMEGQEVLSRTCSTKHGRSDLKSCQSRMNSSTALSVLWEDRIKPDSVLRIYGQYPSTLYYRVIRSPKTCSALVEGSTRGIKPPSAQSCRHGCLPSHVEVRDMQAGLWRQQVGLEPRSHQATRGCCNLNWLLSMGFCRARGHEGKEIH